MIIYNIDYSIDQEISPFTDEIGELSIPNKKLCTLFYDAKDGGFNMEISLHDFLLRKTIPREKIHKLSKEVLENCQGFDHITLVGFQSDNFNKVQNIDIANFEEFEYSDRKSCFVYYFPHGCQKLHSVRLDHLLDRSNFPHVQLGDDSESNNDDHAISQEAINNAKYLEKVKNIHEYLYSFKKETCTTCKNSWFVTKSETPGGVKLAMLDPHKRKKVSNMIAPRVLNVKDAEMILLHLVFQNYFQRITTWILVLCMMK